MQIAVFCQNSSSFPILNSLKESFGKVVKVYDNPQVFEKAILNNQTNLVYYIDSSIRPKTLSLFKKSKGNIQYLYVISNEDFYNYRDDLFELDVRNCYDENVKINTLKFDLEKIKFELKTEQFLFYKQKNKVTKLRISEIKYIETEGNYSYIHTGSKKVVLKKSLKRVLDGLGNEKIFQVFRNVAVNVDFISKIDFNNDLLFLSEAIQLPIGNNFKRSLKIRINESFVVL